MHILTALDRYDTHLAACGRSEHTRRQVGRHVRQFERWWGTGRRCGAVKAVGHEHVARFLASPAGAPTARRAHQESHGHERASQLAQNLLFVVPRRRVHPDQPGPAGEACVLQPTTTPAVE